jgi:ssDNA-binding Zn-finger/Zn-ribbon topoisomerase 1
MSDDPERQALSDAARAMAAARRVVGERKCPECGTAFVATTAGRYKRQFCSPKCRLRAYRRTHADELNERQRQRRAEQKQGRIVGEGK